ncbi:uncharacterized protein KRP23_10230 [Phytophthora ramorum]|uniref:uncharacterized protein n=1 Tax=Phytophthora ramorum TaxID=164328 RepID=UPI0030A4BFAE|nr:hypothetical protein KRP23_10230 [Phytophthora ramorum]
MEEQEGGDAVDWREAFDDLLVFEQDFDTAMQILMFQDEKVARLSLEEPSLTMRRTGRRAKSRTSARSSSKKRRRTEASEAAREEPPIPPLGSCTQSSGLWSSVANSAEEEEATQAPWTQQYSSVEMQEYAAPQFDEAYEDVGAPGTGETGGKPSETGRNARVNGAATTAVSSSDGANREKGNSSVGTSPTAVSSLFQTRSGKVATVSSGHVEEVGANVMFEGNNVEVAANLGECFSAQNREHKVQVTTGALTVNSQNLQPDDVDFSKASGPAYFPDDAENNAAKVQYRCHRVSTIGKNNSGATVSSLFQTAAGDTVAISKARLTDYTEKLFKELSPDPQPLQTTTVTNPHHANRCHTMASTLFTTGSGKAVSVSKVRLQAYEAKLRSEEEMVAASTTSERRDVHGAGGGVNAKADSAATVPSLFQTGSGKAVSVSKVRLQAYEAKLRSEEEMVAASTTSERRDVHGAGGGVNAKADSAATVPSLFQTGSGKAVSVSKVRLQAYEAKLRSEEEMVAASTTSERRDVHGAGGGVNAKADSAATVPSLFQTGSGKAVSVSKVRLQAYEAKLRSEEEMVAASTTSERRDVHGAGGGVNAKADSAATVPSLFQTGSGKAVSVSKVRLQAYEAKLRSEEEMVAASTTSERRDVHGAGGGVNAKADSAATVPSLFQTGSGKAVSVSKVRLQAYEAKLRSEEEMVAASTTSERRDVHGAGGGVNAKADSAATVPSLFQTGSGKAVSVSKVRLQAYEAKLRSEEEMVAASTTSERRDVHGAGGGVNAKADSAATVPSLFQTGSGKAVSVSKVRLQAYEAKLRSEEEMVAASTTSERRDVHGAGGGVNAKADSAATVPSLFQTGSGKAVSVSKVRLQAYEAKLRSEEEMVAASTTSERRDVHGAGGGVNAKADSAATVPSLFQTGSGKAVSVSKVRLQAYEAKLRSEEEMVAASTTSERRDVHGAGGGVNAKADSAATVPSLFQTGSGKAVSVSKVRLQAYEAKLRSEEEMVAASTTSERRDVHGAGGGVNAKADSAATVPSLFQTGSGKAVSVSKVRLQAYEAKLRSEEEMVAASTTSERRDVHGAGGGVNAKADSAATVPSLFQTGSGKAVSVSKVRLQAYEAKLRSEEEMVAASTTSERRDVHGAGGGVNAKADSAATVPSLFQTGSGKAVSVSKVQLQAYEAKLRSEEEPMSDEGRGAGSVSGDIEVKVSRSGLRNMDSEKVSGSSTCTRVLVNRQVSEIPRIARGSGGPIISDRATTFQPRQGQGLNDAPLAAMLWKSHAKSSLVGTKIATWNAGLQNSTEGIDPLECAIVRESQWKNPLLAKEDLTQWPYLLLRYNSTRRARFETRLGVEKLHFMIPTNPRARKQQPQLTFSMLKSVPLKSLEVGGGMVRSVRIRVTRISPVLHLQANEWTLGPRILCEEQLPTYFQLRSEYGRASMQRKIQQHGVGSGAEDWLNDDQIDVPPPIPFIKMDVECTHPSNGNQGVGCGILTVWRPSEELLSSVLREGAEYFASSLTVNWKVDGGRGQDAFVRLGSTKHSGFEEVHDDLSLDDKEAKGTAQLKRNQRVCVDVQQATTDYRANFESDRRNERRPTIDVCVCVVLVTTRETQDGSSIAAKRQAEVSLLDPTIKPKESRYVEHVFVTDKSRHLMSIRVSGMEVSMLKKKTSPLKRGSSSSFAFRRGSKRIWKEGAVLCLSGLEVSHYDEQLRVLDCVLVESTQIVSFPSKNSPFWNHFQCLQREAGISTSRRSASEPTSSEFFEELAHLKKYVERDILRMDFVPSQECDEHYVEVVEQERLTQDLQAHEGGGEQTNESSGTVNRHLRWDGTVVKILPLPGSSKFIFPRNVIALVCICIRTDDNAFRSVYLTQEAVISMQALLQGTDVEKQLSLKEGGPTEDDAALVLCTMKMLNKTNADKTFQFEVRQATNERLINSWKPWDRLHASYWVANTVTSAPPPTD